MLAKATDWIVRCYRPEWIYENLSRTEIRARNFTLKSAKSNKKKELGKKAMNEKEN